LALQHILYRQKEQFSDGVGYSWIDGLKAHAAEQVISKSVLAFFCYFFYFMSSQSAANLSHVYIFLS